MSISMKVEVIPNRGVASMAPEIERGLGWAREADIVTAFVTPAPLRRLESALGRARTQRRPFKIRALVGLYQCFTPPTALAKLINLRKRFPGKLYVRVARNKRFHWKLYAFRNGGERRFFVGSANLTQDGMTAEGELCVKITAAARDAISKSLEAEFDRLWQDKKKSVTLDNLLLGEYRKVARPAQRYTEPGRDKALEGVLVAPERFRPEASSPEPAGRARPRVSYTPLDVSEETGEIVRAETNWDGEGWGYTVYRRKDDFERDLRAGVLLLVTRHARTHEHWLNFEIVRDEAVLDTPDGKYFLARSRVRYSRERRYDEEVGRALKTVGLSLKTLKSEPALNRTQLFELCRLLHVRPEKLFEPDGK